MVGCFKKSVFVLITHTEKFVTFRLHSPYNTLIAFMLSGLNECTEAWKYKHISL